MVQAVTQVLDEQKMNYVATLLNRVRTGLYEIVEARGPFISRHNTNNSTAELYSYGPQVRVFLGCADATKPAPDRFVPGPFDTVDDILARMSDAGFDTIWLLSSHTIAAVVLVDPCIPGTGFESTP
ncbi:hypothetical protein BD310DRAFT_979327 [Dichomitus squalens]|uniref:Uncharacterized protein n=1 Tax=Dichomitus squalens TaxID=114155 RepID=A0A4V2K7E0_9APHY|nr:hypothetical protein BD310DRAFT_979327 [Dichomitus squalens]